MNTKKELWRALYAVELSTNDATERFAYRVEKKFAPDTPLIDIDDALRDIAWSRASDQCPDAEITSIDAVEDPAFA